MAKVEIYASEHLKEVLKVYTPHTVQLKAAKLSVDVDVDDKGLADSLRKDALLIQQFHDQLKKQKVVETFVEDCAGLVRNADFEAIDGNQQKAKSLDKDIAVLGKSYEKQVEKAFGDALDAWQKKKSDVKKYKFKCGIRITTSAVLLAGAIAGLATAATPAAAGTLVPAVITIIKSSAKIGGEVMGLRADAEKMDAKVLGDLEKYKKLSGVKIKDGESGAELEASKAAKAKSAALEVGGKLLADWTGDFGRLGVPSVSGIRKDNAALKAKAAQLEKKAHELAVKLNEFLDKSGKLTADLTQSKKSYDELHKKLTQLPKGAVDKKLADFKKKSAAVDQATKALGDLERATDAMIKEVEGTASRSKKFESRAKVYDDALTKLDSVTSAGKWARVGDALVLISNVGTAQAGGWDADKALGTALKSLIQLEKGAIAELERKV